MNREKAKINGRIRYDNAFKKGAIRMITEQHIPIKEVLKSDKNIQCIKNFAKIK